MNRSSLLAVLAIAAPLAAQPRSPSLTRHIEYWNPAWSPDGRSIVFESTVDGNSAIYSIGPDGNGLRRLTDPAHESGQARWSPDGMRIAFFSNQGGHGDIYLMNADGSALQRLTNMPSGGYYQASFSPDGKWIVFQGRPDNRLTRDRIFIIGADGAGFRQLTDSTYGAEGPRWSVDGKTITFEQVPYPKRFWSEMRESDLRTAKAGARKMSIRPDGSGLAPAPETTAARAPESVPEDAERSADGTRYTYTKSVDGWAGLYVYDVQARMERMIAGGAGAGPIGYIRTSTLTQLTDTLDTYENPKSGGAIHRGNGSYVVRTVGFVAGMTWGVTDTWYDSAGRVTARQSSRTTRGALWTEAENVRADADSASLLVAANRVTAWVVPAGKAAQLFEGPSQMERYASVVVLSAIAKSRPPIGKWFLFPTSSLYGGNPLEVRVDSMRVARRDTVLAGTRPVPVVVLERTNGGQVWLDETTGAAVVARGNAGPERYWWHIRRGVTPPSR